MKKKTFQVEKLTPEQLKRAQIDHRFSPMPEEQLTNLIMGARKRKIRVRYLTTSPDTLVPHNPAALERAQASLTEDTTLREDMLRGLLDESLPAILAYRNPNGGICSFDDYGKLAVALDAKLATVRVVVLGEGDEWFKAKGQASTARKK